jgi:pimeloyl-ACP methyl ester carboxylesterase
MNSLESFPPSSIYLKTSGFVFDALTSGAENGPLILLLHGFPQFADSWTTVMSQLAAAGYRVIAVNQRGYSRGARPPLVSDYARTSLVADAVGFADAVDASRFHLVGHDWGGTVAWSVAATHPERLYSLTVLSTPHLDAFTEALNTDPDQQKRSSYFQLFRAPNHAAESALLADDAKVLQGAYLGKLSASEVNRNVRRFSEDGTLTGALNWYRATTSVEHPLGSITVPTTYIWGDQDQALGEVAAFATAKYVTGPYRFERLSGKSHWLLEECPDEVATLILNRVIDARASPVNACGSTRGRQVVPFNFPVRVGQFKSPRGDRRRRYDRNTAKRPGFPLDSPAVFSRSAILPGERKRHSHCQ